MQLEMLGSTPLNEAPWQGRSLGRDGWIPAAVLFRIQLEASIEVLHAELQGAKVVDVREFCVVEDLLASVR